MSSGPYVSAVLECNAEDAKARMRGSVPFVVRGGVSHSRWSNGAEWNLESLSRRVQECGDVSPRVQDGLVEQGVTKQMGDVRAGSYLRALAAAPRDVDPETELVSPEHVGALADGQAVPLRWDRLRVLPKPYLGIWDIFGDLPRLRRGLDASRSLWSRWTYAHAFAWAGPAHTLTGLHYDMPDNWFVQLDGVKVFIMFPREQRHLFPVTSKYDCGARLCALDVSRETPDARASGWYVRLSPGDALFVPKGTLHSVLSLSPSLSVSEFGYTPRELLTVGLPLVVAEMLHRLGVWRWGCCTCHHEGARRPRASTLIAVLAIVFFYVRFVCVSTSRLV